jgi:membrane protease YdiL (CAAX protease family)
MRKIVVKHPVIVFCVFSLILLSVIGGLNLILYPSSFNYALMFPQWSPALAAILVVGILNGKNGIYNLFRQTSIKASNLKWILIAIIIPAVCCGLSYVILMFVENGQWIPPTLPRSIGNYAICLIATIFGCYGEEIGWRGFMLPKLNKKHSLFISSLIVGLFWGVWHMRFQIGLPAFGLFVLGVVCYSFLISWLCSKTKNNMFVAIVFHTTINMCSLLLFENILSDITEQQTEIQIGNPHLYSVLYGIYAIVFLIPCLFIAKNRLNPNNINKDA